MPKHSVLKEWVFELPYRMQSVLMCSLRGCDTARKDDPSKFITRGLRAMLLNNADPTNTFIVEGVPDPKHVKTFLWDMDSYPLHYVMHTLHAAEIAGYKHPDKDFRKWWLSFYLDLVKGLHLNPETEAQLDIRLGFTPAERKALGIGPQEVQPNFEEDWADVRPERREPAPKPPPRAKQLRKTMTKKDGTVWDAGTGTSHGGRNRDWSGGS